MNKKTTVLLIFGAIALTYCLLSVVPYPPQETLDEYNLTAASARVINFTFFVPLALVWYIAVYGYLKLERYHAAIAGSKDGKQVAKLKDGILVLALGLPLNSLVSLLLNTYARSRPDLEPGIVVVRNYFALLVPLIAFSLISWGARGLAELTGKRPAQRVLNSIVLLTLLLGFTFVYLIFQAPGLFSDSYHLTLAPFLFTLIIPYTFMWFLGLFAAYEIYMYSRKVKGVVYRKSWRLLSYGLVSIVIFSITLQYLGSLTSVLEAWSLPSILLLLYLLLLLWAASYVLVALGAKRLMKIEEV